MFSHSQMEILQAVVDRVIPPDEWPGGWEAGVGNYLMWQFRGDLKSTLPLYRQALDALETEAQTRAGQSFATLTPDAQDNLLRQVEQGQVQTAWPLDPAAWFQMLCQHCAEGFYSDPGNSGNRGNIAWQMIGFEVRG